jgi:DNA-binding transcriptional ArsR family regulator
MPVGACWLAVWDVLAEPARRRILDLLLDGERTVGELVDAVGLSQPAVSKHLRVLRDAGAVEARVDGPRRVYRLRADSLRDVDDWLTPYRAAWAGRLDALARHLDDMEARDETNERRRPRRARTAR